MKLIEIAVLVILLPLFSGILLSNFKILDDCRKTYAEKAREFGEAQTIANGFKNLCAKNDCTESDFKEFAESCSSLFALDSLQIEIVGIKDRKKLLKCTWKKAGSERIVLSIAENAL